MPLPIDTLRDKARWADVVGENVDPNRPRNLAERNRAAARQADRDAYAEALVEQRTEQEKQLMLRDRRAQSYYFGMERLNLAKESHDAQMRARDRDFQEKQAMERLKLKSEQSRINAANALERERLAREKSINDKATKDANNRTAVFEKWTALNNDTTAKPGSPDYAKRTLDILVQHGGGLDASTRKMLTDTAKITTANDPEAAADEAVAGWESIHSTLKDKGLNAKVTGRLLPSGKMGFSLSEATAPTGSATRVKEIDKEIRPLATEWRRLKTKEPTSTPIVEPAIEALRKEREGLVTPTPTEAPAIGEAPASPQPAATRRPLDDIFK